MNMCIIHADEPKTKKVYHVIDLSTEWLTMTLMIITMLLFLSCTYLYNDTELTAIFQLQQKDIIKLAYGDEHTENFCAWKI